MSAIGQKPNVGILQKVSSELFNSGGTEEVGQKPNVQPGVGLFEKHRDLGTQLGSATQTHKSSQAKPPKLSKSELFVLVAGGIHDNKGQLTSDGQRLQNNLVGAAKSAYEKDDFESRNTTMANAVAKETAILTAAATGSEYSEIAPVFAEATKKAGEAFAEVFDPNKEWSSSEEREAAYNKAMNSAGPVAYETLGKLVDNPGETLEQTRLQDLMNLVAEDFGYDISNISEQDVITALKKIVPEDNWSFKDIATIPLTSEGDQPLSSEQRKDLRTGIRLANATWKTGQVHRARWEGNTDRINPEVRTAFNLFDVLKQKMAGNPADGNVEEFAALTFEIFKDLGQLNKAHAAAKAAH